MPSTDSMSGRDSINELQWNLAQGGGSKSHPYKRDDRVVFRLSRGERRWSSTILPADMSA